MECGLNQLHLIVNKVW